MNKTVYIETLGCQMNKSDSERIVGILSQLGYEEIKEPEKADFLIMNTCNIRQLSAEKAYSRIGLWGKWKRKINPDLKIAICGCVAQQDKNELLARMPYLDLVFGTHNIYELPELVKRINNDERVCSIMKTPYECDETKYEIKRESGFNAWIPIIEGCDYFCTYCVVPYTRGRQRSRDPQDIIKEAKEAVRQGFKEITLLGQTVDSYGRDIDDENVTLANLLRELNKIDELVRIRFTTSYPTDITDDLIGAVNELDKVCEAFHIPMQSGSSEVLKNMRRRYTREEYVEIVNKIRAAIPDVAVTSDFIAGFPGETEEQFLETLSIIDELALDYSNTAAYSPRKQTPAATWRDKYISEEVKKERLKMLNDKNKEACKKSNEMYKGRVLDVLVESAKEENGKVICTARTRNNKLVHFAGTKDMPGTLVDVKITGAMTWYLKGEAV